MRIEMKQWWVTGNVADAWREQDVDADMVEAMAEEEASSLRWRIAGVLDHVKSPIERKLLLALLACRSTGQRAVSIPSFRLVREWASSGAHADTRFGDHEEEQIQSIGIDLQRKVGKYSADFVVSWSSTDGSGTATAEVYVECDGHDFHERTKKQAEHDKKRDRHFTAQGLTLLRFTGSEIHRAPAICASEIFGELWRRYDTERRRLWDLANQKAGV